MTSTHGEQPHPHGSPAATSEDEAFGYALWAVLRKPAHPHHVTGNSSDVDHAIDLLASADRPVVVRGVYDVSGLRADADVLLWLHGDQPEDLQAGLRQLRRTNLLKDLLPTWNALGVHRPAEFSANHVPAFLAGTEPAAWLTVYPFVRSYEWYLLPSEERRAMLGQHGRKGREYPNVLSNTVSSFALGDYEWILALEAEELVDLVDLMRHLRDTDARRHVREEVPFFTGRRIETAELPEVLG